MSKRGVVRLAWGFLIGLIGLSAIIFVAPYLSFKPSPNGPIKLNTAIDLHFPLLVTHAIGGGLALLLGPFQFIASWRSKRPAVHHWIGRLYMLSVLVASVCGFSLAIISTTNFATRVGFACLAVMWFYSLWRAYQAIRRRQISQHRVWMIRNYALTLAAITLRVWLGIAMFLLQMSFEQAYVIAAWGSWLLPLAVAEWLILRKAKPVQLRAEAKAVQLG